MREVEYYQERPEVLKVILRLNRREKCIFGN
jgi:hypothetical protein